MQFKVPRCLSSGSSLVISGKRLIRQRFRALKTMVHFLDSSVKLTVLWPDSVIAVAFMHQDQSRKSSSA